MHGRHARHAPSTPPYASASAGGPGAKHSRRRGRTTGRLRRRLLAYRAVDFRDTHIPQAPSGRASEECLLLVHVRRVVGQVHYRMCERCARGVITDISIDEHFHKTGLGTRALSHLRARHPGVTWRNTLTGRSTRDLVRRMCIPPGDAQPCAHTA
ncbi:hypothetical protein ACIP93_25665 [Streptomyces sp. NPDC088745]|uniref:hypothetical protein n=1 Tax=Streptomyces sp. NPDC088745 TaxID=3365884 RepID=UPI0037FBAC6F